MLQKTTLKPIVPGQWARTLVPDYEVWQRDGTPIHPCEEVDICVMPSYQPRYGYPRCFEWYDHLAYRRPGSDYFYREAPVGNYMGPWTFRLLSPVSPEFRARTEEHRDYSRGTGKHL